MKIAHRINSAKSILRYFGGSGTVVPAFTRVGDIERQIRELGLSWPLVVGERILPPGHCGPDCDRNANGWVEPDRTRPMEVFHYDQLWKWKMKRGLFFADAAKFVERTGHRYPRVFYPPSSLEVHIVMRSSGQQIIALEELTLGGENEQRLKIGANVMVELFGSCELLTENLSRPKGPSRNWEVSMSSEDPAISTRLHSRFLELPPQKRRFAESRIEELQTQGGRLHAIGLGGFSKIVALAFGRGLWVLDDFGEMQTTIGLKASWPDITIRSKAALFRRDSISFEIAHDRNWRSELLKAVKRFG